MKKAVFVVAAVVLIIVVGGVFAYNVYYNTREKEVEKAFAFSTKDIDGNWINLTDHKGKIVILDFVYFDEGTCPHCKESNLETFRLLEEITKKYNDTVLSIVINMTPDPAGDRIRAIRDEYNIALPMINDFFPGSSTQREWDETDIGKNYLDYFTANGEFANPTILLLDQDQYIRYWYQVSIYKKGIGFVNNENIDVTQELLSKHIDKGVEDDWPGTIEGQYISSEVQLLGMFVLGIFLSITPCALAIFVSMTTYVLATRGGRGGTGEKVEEEEDKGLVLLSKGDDEPLLKRIFKSNEFYGLLVGGAFTLGMGTVFFVMGTLITYLTSIIKANAFFFEIFFIIAGVILIIIGINNIKSIVLMLRGLMENLKKDDPDKASKETIFDRVKDMAMMITSRSGIVGAFLLGVILTLGWAPCILSYVFPIFILVSYQEINFLMGGIYLFVMALGFGVPIIMISTISMSLKGEISQNLMGIGKVVRIVFSGLIILFGLYLIISTIFPEYSVSHLLGL